MKNKTSTLPETFIGMNGHIEIVKGIRILKLDPACGRQCLLHFLYLKIIKRENEIPQEKSVREANVDENIIFLRSNKNS